MYTYLFMFKKWIPDLAGDFELCLKNWFDFFRVVENFFGFKPEPFDGDASDIIFSPPNRRFPSQFGRACLSQVKVDWVVGVVEGGNKGFNAF